MRYAPGYTQIMIYNIREKYARCVAAHPVPSWHAHVANHVPWTTVQLTPHWKEDHHRNSTNDRSSCLVQPSHHCDSRGSTLWLLLGVHRNSSWTIKDWHTPLCMCVCLCVVCVCVCVCGVCVCGVVWCACVSQFIFWKSVISSTVAYEVPVFMYTCVTTELLYIMLRVRDYEDTRVHNTMFC